MLEDAQYRLAIAESRLGTVDNEKEQEISTLKELVCVCVFCVRSCVCGGGEGQGKKG